MPVVRAVPEVDARALAHRKLALPVQHDLLHRDLGVIETTIEPDKKGGFGVLPLPLIVLCGGNPQKFVRDLESAHLSDSTHFWGS